VEPGAAVSEEFLLNEVFGHEHVGTVCSKVD